MPTANDENIVIVIDPGHGGENLGADYEDYLEKDMNMVTANAMAEELAKYEGITVYLTHTEDVDMSLEERAEFAKEVNADFLFCLHFNMSVKHDLFGSEVWVSAFGDQYAKGAAFGEIQMQAMQEMGLYLRGVKTKLNDRGTDYYGILRYCTKYQIPAALIEHCHVDNEADSVFCDSEEEWIAFGKADATCVAKFFGLKSEVLGVDYSNYLVSVIQAPPEGEAVRPDETAPEICYIEALSADYETGEVQIQISGDDTDSPMLYFSYSLDAGQTYSELKAWPESDSFQFTFTVPSGTTPTVRVRVYNLYDLYTESNNLYFQSFVYSVDEEVPGAVSGEDLAGADATIPVIGTAENPWTPHDYGENDFNSRDPFLGFLALSLLVAGIVFVSALILKLSAWRKRKNKRNKSW